ncbi:MAG: ferrous iron transport protein A, partial [Oculatellaceae cyanobacterium Prado106]|nr:ferrous iron transport protein A [Oculatellaceae cyanobacterium Prado106]
MSSRRMGDRICIVELECGDTNQRLIAMGLIPGAVLEIVSTTATGSVIVALQDQRLGLGAEMAQRIQVADIAQPSRANAADSTRPSSRITTMQTSLSQSIQTSPSQSPVKLRDVAIGTTLKIVGYEPVARDYKRKLLA